MNLATIQDAIFDWTVASTGLAGNVVTWEEHLEAWNAYHRRYPGQSAERIAERGGFGYWEITQLLGHGPKTWQPHQK